MISIVTPSFRQLDWLRLALASVADQNGVEIEHIIQDAGTEGVKEMFEDETNSFDHQHCTTKLFVEKDTGMYDAINRGLNKTGGEICAYLNCDEQYLPQALSSVATQFRNNPNIDILCSGSLVLDEHGRYICSRPALKPSLRDLKLGRMYNLSSSMFFRARLFRERNLYFDPALRIIGDLDWLRRAIEAGARVETFDRFTSTFSDLGTNLALSSSAGDEITKNSKNLSHSLSYSTALVLHRIRRLLAGHYSLPPFDYSIYTLAQPKARQTFHVQRPTGVWRNRL